MNKSKRITFLVDVIISLLISLFVLGVTLEFTDNDVILSTIFLVSLIFQIWYAWNKPFASLEYKRKKPTISIEKSEVEETKKEEIQRVQAPLSLAKPTGTAEKKLIGRYNGRVESWWYDSDCDTHNDWHRVYLSLHPDGVILAGPDNKMDLKNGIANYI
ncbi:MAG: hypothetical protein GY816_23960 [Cytophagales bacterium]|nr:hypothetical protein [Cytophagales bacterium]